MLMHLDMNSSRLDSSDWNVRVDCQGCPPQQFNCQDIGKLFQGRVGAVVGATEHFENGRKWIKVSFRGEDEFRKALCMSGYTIDDTSIQVTSWSSRQFHSFSKPKSKISLKSKRDSDTRRNLYILNLPHDLPVPAYRELFTPYGTPTHTVLLKTQDSCSRRRGFVVMSTHEEALNVIRWLDGICIRGFQLRVTWANIDRSNGFMSGYDRTALLASPSPNRPASVPNTPLSEMPADIAMDTTTVVASNIPLSLFPHHEIDSLFKPFGMIKNIQLIPPNPSPEDRLSTLAPASPLAQTAIVTFVEASDAIAAKNILHGQVYEGFTLAVGFVSTFGIEDHHSAGTLSASPVDSANPCPSIHRAASFSALDNLRMVTPALTFEETFRGLPPPVNFYDVPLQLQYGNVVSPNHPNCYNWTGFSPLIPQPLNHHVQQTTHASSLYSPDPVAHLRHRHHAASDRHEVPQR